MRKLSVLVVFTFSFVVVISVICVVPVISGSSLCAQESQLGRVQFPTSGSEKAQAHFLRGLAALHSFWYEEALEAFRESTKLEPDFAMGYWGEAMTYNHPLWSEQDIAAARQVLARIKETPKLTQRERDYLAAVKLLYGDGDKRARDAAYSAAMEKIYRTYPEDLDAAAFYSLSLLGMVRAEEKSYCFQAKAGAIALDVYQKNPNHPGAAHYIIHAFDDPEHAILALPAARRYAAIAPEAHHARHMPSHIFSTARNVARGCSFERVGVGIVGRVDEAQKPFRQRARLPQSALAAVRLSSTGSLQRGREVAQPDEEGDVGIDVRQQAAPGLLRKQLREHGSGVRRRN